MHRLLIAAAAACVFFPASTPAQQKQRGKAPPVKLTTAAVKASEQVYKKTPQGELLMHLWSPPDAKPGDKRPAILFFFGGGWKSGSFTQFIPQSEYFASRGMIAAAADYRISSIHKTTPDKCVEDAKSAMRWLRAHAAELGIDPAKIVASGGSAGGHLAAATALLPGFDAPGDDPSISAKPCALVLFNPALNLTMIDGRQVLDGEGKDIAKPLSPTLFLGEGAPPAIIFFGTADRLSAHGREYLARARQHANRAELHTAADMPHGFFNRSPWTEVTAKQADEFLASLGLLSGPPAIQLPENAPSLQRAPSP